MRTRVRPSLPLSHLTPRTHLALPNGLPHMRGCKGPTEAPPPGNPRGAVTSSVVNASALPCPNFRVLPLDASHVPWHKCQNSNTNHSHLLYLSSSRHCHSRLPNAAVASRSSATPRLGLVEPPPGVRACVMIVTVPLTSSSVTTSLQTAHGNEKGHEEKRTNERGKLDPSREQVGMAAAVG